MATFTYHNENPKGRKTADCTTRAIATASGFKYSDVLKMQYEEACSTGYFLNDIKTTNSILSRLGFTEAKIKVQKGQSRPTVRALVDSYSKGRYALVISVAGHLTCAVGSYIYDLWDCGMKSVYKYWYKKL